MQYEITFIVKDEATPDEVLAVFGQTEVKLNELIDMGSKQFAFPIGKLNSGHYYTSEFDCSTDKIIKIEKFLRLKKTLVRFLIVKKIRFPEKTSKTALAEAAAKEAKKPLGDKKTEESIEVTTDEPKVEAIKKEEPKLEKKVADKPVKATKKIEEKPKPKATKKAPVKKVSKVELDKQLEEMVKED